MENIDQKIVDKYLADSEEFWTEFHNSLEDPSSPWSNHSNKSLDEWVKYCKQDSNISTHLKILFKYPLMKGEYPKALESGFILTNHRLIINDSDLGVPSIPLSNITYYNEKDNGLIKFIDKGKEVEAKYSIFLITEIVNNAKRKFESLNLEKNIYVFLKNCIYDLNNKFDLGIESVIYPKKYLGEEKDEKYPNKLEENKNESNKDSESNFLKVTGAIAVFILAFILIGNLNSAPEWLHGTWHNQNGLQKVAFDAGDKLVTVNVAGITAGWSVGKFSISGNKIEIKFQKNDGSYTDVLLTYEINSDTQSLYTDTGAKMHRVSNSIKLN